MTEDNVTSITERGARAAFDKASIEFQSVLSNLLQSAGGVNIAQLMLSVQLSALQFNVLVELLVEAAPELKEKFWLKCIETFDNASAEIRKKIISTPGIIKTN